MSISLRRVVRLEARDNSDDDESTEEEKEDDKDDSMGSPSFWICFAALLIKLLCVELSYVCVIETSIALCCYVYTHTHGRAVRFCRLVHKYQLSRRQEAQSHTQIHEHTHTVLRVHTHDIPLC